MTPEQAQRLGAVLRSRREAASLSLRKLEALSGVTNVFIVQLEAGRVAKPDADKLTRLGAVLGLTLAELFAAADIADPSELFPTFTPYLRARYGQLPEDAVAEMTKAFGRIAKKYGVDPDGPTTGEDEDDTPPPTADRRRARK